MDHTADPETKDQAEASPTLGRKAVYAEHGRQYSGQA